VGFKSVSIAYSMTHRRRITRAGLGATTACVASAMGLQAGAQAVPDKGTEVSSVVVTARKPGIGVLTEKIQNTAQTINVIPKEVLKQQGVASLQEALKNIPGVTLNAGEGGAHGDTVNLRGFPANDDFFLDGMRDTGFYTRDAFNLESLEVYKGPASTLFGRGSTGGVINQVSKQPHLGESASGTLTVGGKNETRGTVDLDYGLGDNAALRLNAMDQSSGVEGQRYVLNRRWGVAPELALGIGTDTTLTADYLHQHEDNVPDPGIPYIGSAPAPVSRDAYYGLPSDDRTKATVDVVTLKLNHKINDALSVSESLRYGNYDFISHITEPYQGVTQSALLAPGAILTNPVCANNPATSATVILDPAYDCRDRPAADGLVRTAMSDTEVTYKVDTGPLSHTIVGGIEFDQEGSHQLRYANQITLIAPTALANPDPNEAFPGHQSTVTSRPDVDTQTVSGLISDSIDFGSQWNLVAALRVDRFHARSVTTAVPSGTVTQAERTDTIATPRVSLVYKPTPNASLYASYGTSYDPSAENLSLSATTAALAPEKDRTYEIGGKAAVLNQKLALTAAIFDTQMTNARVSDPVTKVTSLQGNLRVRGAEVGASGYLTKHIEVIAGYTYLDAVTASSLTASAVGKELPNTAHNQANLWALYEFTEEFKIGAGVNYLGRRAADASGVAYIPAYTTLDGMISYQLNSHIGLQLNATNLTDKYYFTNAYYSSLSENHVIPGAGRTILFTVTGRY
jgi:catecholate siderophore receptor